MTPHKREVMQMALNALEIYGAQAPAVNDTIEALHACLAQFEHYDQTELALCKKCGWKAVWPDGCLVCEKQEAQPVAWKNGYKAGYAQAQETDLAIPRKEWVGLTENELSQIHNSANWNHDIDWSYERAIEAKLKKKNT